MEERDYQSQSLGYKIVFKITYHVGFWYYILKGIILRRW